MSITHEELRDGSRFGHLFDTYSAKLYRFVVVQVRDREDAEEIVSVTFTKVWELVNRREGTIEQPSAFLYRVARNCLIDFVRRRRLNVSIDELIEKGQEPTNRSSVINTDALDARTLVTRGLDALKPADRELLLWRFVEGIAVTEIATMIGKTENATSVRIFRALARVRNVITREKK